MVNPRSLAAADFDLNQAFEVDLNNLTAASAVDQFASTLGLKAESVENRFWLLQAKVAEEDKLPWSMKIDDLVKSPEQRQWLAETIELLHPGTSTGLSFSDENLTGKPDVIDRLTWFSIARL